MAGVVYKFGPARQERTFQAVRYLARGGQGNVYVAKEVHGTSSYSDKEYALKEVVLFNQFDGLTKKTEEQYIAQLRESWENLFGLRHPHLVEYLHAEIYFELPFRLDLPIAALVMEYCPQGSLKSLLRSTFLAHEQAQSYAYQMLQGLAYLHTQRTPHRDLTPDNVVLRDVGVPGIFLAKLVDFEGSPKLSRSVTMTIDRKNWLYHTKPYMPPEINFPEKLSRKSDIWSFACVVKEMFERKKRPRASSLLIQQAEEARSRNKNPLGTVDCDIFPDSDALLRNGKINVSEVPEDAQRFLERCLKEDPEDRAEAVQLLHDPWLLGVSFPPQLNVRKLSTTTMVPRDMEGNFAKTTSVAVPTVARPVPADKPEILVKRNVDHANQPGDVVAMGSEPDGFSKQPAPEYAALSSQFSVDLEDLSKFEHDRITSQQEDRQAAQSKAFTKWINGYLSKEGLIVHDLFADLSDGKLLLRLLEVLTGEDIGYPKPGKQRFQKLENVNKCLKYIGKTGTHLESIGAADIVDGNRSLILGLIWTLILRFQIQHICASEETQGPQVSAKEALLLWAQQRTEGYQSVSIRNFTSSWKDGLGFVALLHSYCPELIVFENRKADEPVENLTYAFDVAEKNFGVAHILDPADVFERPDEKSIMIYLSSCYYILPNFAS